MSQRVAIGSRPLANGRYAAGLSVRDIQAHLEDLYGLRVSPDLISRVTDAVLEFKLVRAADQTVRGTV